MVMDRQHQQGKAAAFNLAEAGFGDRPDLDDDGRERRTGTLVTASAHIITAVIGSGVLSLAWAIAQLGWVIGPVVLLAFSVITWFCSSLLADCYRAPDPVHGKRNYTYGQAVRAYLGVSKYRLCALAQYINLTGVTIGYTITTAISMGGTGAAPPPPSTTMTTPGSNAMAAGWILLVLAASVGLTFGGVSASLASLLGVLAGANLVVGGVRMADHSAAAPIIGPVVWARARALAELLRRNRGVAGLVVASSAVTAVSGAPGPALCFAMLAMLVLGLSLVIIQVAGA